MASSTASSNSVERLEDEQEGGSDKETLDQQPHTQWMENKSQVLDEVDQLVDLMAEEKVTLTKKITDLETLLEEMSKKGSGLEEEKCQLQSECERAKRELEEMQEEHLKERSDLNEALAAAKRELAEVKKKVESLTCDLITEQENKIKITSTKADLKHRLKCLQGERRSVGAALELQCRENVKASEQCKSLVAQNSLLQDRLESAQQKLKYSQDEVLALRGRLTTSKRSHDQLQAKCSELDKALNDAMAKSPTVVKVVSRSKEELRLLTECKRKDGVIESLREELGAERKTRLKSQDQIRRLEQRLKCEQKDKQLSQKTLEEKRLEWEKEKKSLQESLGQSVAELQAKEAKEEETCSEREHLQSKLSQIEEELASARGELNTLREDLKEKTEKSQEETVHLEQEHEKSKALHQVQHRTIAQLRRELDERRDEHAKSVNELNDKWEGRMREAKEDYRRMVEVSTRRCTALAREVWQLKSQLQEVASSCTEANETTPTDTNHLTPHN